MAAVGTKRSEPGSDKEKKNGVAVDEVTLSEEDEKKLEQVRKDFARAEIVVERRSHAYLKAAFEKRRAVVKSIPKFWFTVLSNCDTITLYAQHEEDRAALEYVEDIWIERDEAEPRAFTVEMHFKENPWFSDRVLKKEYKYLPPTEGPTPDKADADGITNAALDFDWERDVAAQAIKINWKDSNKSLTKLYPRVNSDDPTDIPEEGGSFFNFFEVAIDPYEIGPCLATEVFPDAVEYFLGRGGDVDLEDSEEEDSEDEDEEEIDLEKPRKKKARQT